MSEPLRVWDEIRAMATTGRNFSRSPYDSANYDRLLELASEQYSRVYGVDSAELLARFKKEVGYVTCKLGVNAAVFREGRILLEQRADDRCWGIPGGWVDPNETPEQAAGREIKEEASLHVEVRKLIDVFSRPAGAFGQPHSSCHLLYFCELAPADLATDPQPSHESLALRFCDPREVRDWHRDHAQWVESALRFQRELFPQK
jgi:ADP-ribose pyrophosphatase YjhB (NUDIX family)